MLDVDPRRRITAQKIISHSWIAKRDKLNNSKLERKGKNSIKKMVEATFSALNISTPVELAPVQSSFLARRRKQKNL